jgi:hypothetical protein
MQSKITFIKNQSKIEQYRCTKSQKIQQISTNDPELEKCCAILGKILP